MSRAIPVITLVLGVALGFLMADQIASRNEADLEKNQSAEGEDLVERAEFDAEIATLKKDLAAAKKSADAAFERENKATNDVARLEDELARIQGELATAKGDLQAQATAKSDDRKERLARIEKRFEELKGKGLQTLVATNAIGKLIADLQAEGDVGREAVHALLASEDTDERNLALTLMMQGMADIESIDPLKDIAMNDEDELSMRLASQALMRIEGDDERITTALQSLVDDADDPGVKVNSMFGLLMRGQGIEQAVGFFNDKENDGTMRMALGQSVFLLKNRPEVLPLVDAVFADARGGKSEAGFAKAAIDYYGSVKTPEARSRLETMAGDQSLSAELRNQAAEALAAFN